MSEVDLEPVEAAVASLRVKYPDFVFTTNFEPTISGTRGIFETRISRTDDADDPWIHLMIVPNDMRTKEGYEERIEFFFKEKFGIRD